LFVWSFAALMLNCKFMLGDTRKISKKIKYIDIA